LKNKEIKINKILFYPILMPYIIYLLNKNSIYLILTLYYFQKKKKKKNIKELLSDFN
jgi:hypothetical protein